MRSLVSFNDGRVFPACPYSILATFPPSKWMSLVPKRFLQYFQTLESRLGVACSGG